MTAHTHKKTQKQNKQTKTKKLQWNKKLINFLLAAPFLVSAFSICTWAIASSGTVHKTLYAHPGQTETNICRYFLTFQNHILKKLEV